MTERFKRTRNGALGAVMDLYEEETEFLFQTIKEKVKDSQWSVIVDKDTEDEDCRSIQTICQHIVGAAFYYVDLMKKGEDKEYEIKHEPILLDSREAFEPKLREALAQQTDLYEGRWDLSDDDIEKIVIKTGWGNTLDPETLMEHAVLHIMRHHRQILKFATVA